MKEIGNALAQSKRKPGSAGVCGALPQLAREVLPSLLCSSGAVWSELSYTTLLSSINENLDITLTRVVSPDHYR